MPGIVWWELRTVDAGETQRFLARVFGWKCRRAFERVPLEGPYWVVSDPDRVLGGLIETASGASAAGTGTRLSVEVDDLEEVLAEVVSAGGSVERPRIALGGDDRRFATVLDPTGLALGLWSSHPPRPPQVSSLSADASSAGHDEVSLTCVVAGEPSRVWSALTLERARWWRGMEFEPSPGSSLRETWTEDGRTYVAVGVVEEAQPPSTLSFRWTEEGWPTSLQVQISLEPHLGDTRVHLRESGFTSIPDGAHVRRDHIIGWEDHLHALANVVATHPQL